MLSVCTPSHNPKYLPELWDSLKNQTQSNFEWVVLGQKETTEEAVKAIVGDDPRVKFTYSDKHYRGIGEIKRECFMLAEGDYLVEADHDDLLSQDALLKIQEAFVVHGADFVYSDFADFSPTGQPVTYHGAETRKSWEENGWTFRDAQVNGKQYLAANAWEPSAASLSLIYFAPNHVRAWKRDFYQRIGGHNPAYEVADDHELLIRTYLHGTMHHIPEVLYLYRVEDNTWSKKVKLIKEKTYALKAEYLEKLVLRECELLGKQAVEVGGGINPREGWISCDKENAKIQADLRGRWPFEDGSVGAFRAVDLLEHLPDKQHTISEIYRCLRPGGWLLSFTPSALGAGAFCDPTHCSYWVKRSFEYYTNRNVAKFIRNDDRRFIPVDLFECFPSGWHKQENIPYVVANLIKLDASNEALIPGIKNI